VPWVNLPLLGVPMPLQGWSWTVPRPGLTKNQYLELMEGKSLHLTVTKWLRSFKNTSIRIQRNTPYELNFSFNKRTQVFENGKWVNTSPINLGSILEIPGSQI
jgi:hypothetical protein